MTHSKKTSHKCGGFEPSNLLYLSDNLNNDQLSAQIREIKKQLRSVMNGVASTSMSERGLDYRVNYGVPLTILKHIASKIEKNHDLAQRLWMENVRELKILATFVQPHDSFSKELASDWIERMITTEQAEHLCMNLLQYSNFSLDLTMELLNSENELKRFTAWHLMARIARTKVEFTDVQFQRILTQFLQDIKSDSSFLFNIAVLAMKRVGVMRKQYADRVMAIVNESFPSNSDRKQLLIDDLKFEFDYYSQTSL